MVSVDVAGRCIDLRVPGIVAGILPAELDLMVFIELTRQTGPEAVYRRSGIMKQRIIAAYDEVVLIVLGDPVNASPTRVHGRGVPLFRSVDIPPLAGLGYVIVGLESGETHIVVGVVAYHMGEPQHSHHRVAVVSEEGIGKLLALGIPNPEAGVVVDAFRKDLDAAAGEPGHLPNDLIQVSPLIG